MADPTSFLQSNHSAISSMLVSSQSIWNNAGYQVSQIFAVDNTQTAKPMNTGASFGGTDRFKVNKRGGRIFNTWLKVSISAGVVNVLNEGAYVDDLGNALIQNVRVEYASKTLHEFSGEELHFYQRLMKHDIYMETNYGLTLAGLPPGAGGSEAIRKANISAAQVVIIPLDWLWWTTSEDYALCPEALSAEIEIVVTYRPLNQLVYGRVIIGSAVASPFTTEPAITESLLCMQMIFPPTAERTKHLASFESKQGQVFKILDFERQLNNSVGTAATEYTIKLTNFRMDSKFIMFVVRHDGMNTAWERDRMMSDPTATILSGGGSVASLLPITSMKLKANGNTLVESSTDLEARILWRKMYLPGAQVTDYVYFFPLSSMMLREKKNVVGSQNLNNLGNLELLLTLPAAPAGATARIVDCWNVAHNITQQKEGDIMKILR